MTAAKRGTGFLEEFRSFLLFLKNLWGLLASISVFFPLSNVLISLIPLKTIEEDGVFVHVSPPLITTLASIATLFVVLITFGRRRQIKVSKSIKRVQRQAWFSFSTGLISLLGYLIIYYTTLHLAWDSWGWSSDTPLRLLVEIPMLVTYSTFFAQFTRAFMLLGLREYYSES